MDFVLDASIALSWCFGDEATPTTKRLLDQLQIDTAYVPSIWPLELGNILVGAVRHKRITYAATTQFLSLIQQINIEVDNETSKHAFHDILSLAQTEKLTTYDAAYLELAMRLGLPLASKDNPLCKAASRLGIKVISA